MPDITILSDPCITADVFIGCIGYEDRSAYYLREFACRQAEYIIIFDYESGDIYSYSRNKAAAQDCAHVIVNNMSDLVLEIDRHVSANGNVGVIFDVTSFDREKIGIVLQAIFSHAALVRRVDIVYCPREFVPVPLQFDVVQSFGPVLPIFMGDASIFRRSLTLVLGAGYEYGKAVGAIDTLEPDNIFCFRPTGTDPRFDEFIDQANVNFGFIDNKDHIIWYDLNDARQLYFELRRLVEFENAERAVLLLPLGPKLFAAISMLIGLILHPSIMVWRHSTSSVRLPGSISEAKTTGNLIRFAFRFVEN